MFDAWKKSWQKHKSVIDGSSEDRTMRKSMERDSPETSAAGDDIPINPTSFVPRDVHRAVSSAKAPSAMLSSTSSSDDLNEPSMIVSSIEELDHDGRVENQRPSKRQKIDTASLFEESIPPASPRITPRAFEADAVLLSAKNRNLIIEIDSEHDSITFTRNLLAWATEEESVRVENGQDRRIAVVITSDGEHAQRIYNYLFDAKNASPSLHLDLILDEGSDEDALINPDLTSGTIIITATAMLNFLQKNNLSMSAINILIVEQAHLAQIGHPMAQIFLDHYHPLALPLRPRVVGMLKSIKAYESELLSIENTIDAQVHGVSAEDRSRLMVSVARPQETVTFYEPAGSKRETTLFWQLRALDQDGKVLKKQFAGAAATLRDVGPCAADLVWRRYLMSTRAEAWGLEPEPTGDEAADEAASEIHRIKMKIRNLLKNWTFTMPNLNPSSKSFNVTPKFAKLVQVLQCFEPQGDSFRGIVFVHKRSTAAAIADMLRTLGDQLPFLRPQALVGTERNNAGTGMDLAVQKDIVEEFRNGKTNLLISTRVGEDGIELPSCSCVIRFDLFPNHISYAQSRARTDPKDGHFVLMVEQGNDVHRRIIHSVARLDPQMQQWVDAVASTPGGIVPPRTLLEKANADRVESDDEDAVEEYILDPTTGGRIYAKDATGVIYKYVADANEKGPTSKPLFEYETTSVPNQFICTVVLPSKSPISKVTGQPASSKGEARRVACYETCQQLFKLGFLDHIFFPRPPTIRSFLPDIYANHHLEPDYDARGNKGSRIPVPETPDVLDPNGRVVKGKMSGTRCYARKRPAFWKNTLLTGSTDSLFPTLITMNLSEHTTEKYRTMCFLTRHPLPPIEPFKLFFSGFPAIVYLKRCAPIEVDEMQVELIHKYTLRVCRSVAAKPFECDLSRTPYFFAPMKSGWSETVVTEHSIPSSLPDIKDGIAWAEIEQGAGHWSRPLKAQSHASLAADLEDAVLQDRWIEFTRHFDAITLRADLSPLSKPQAESREAAFNNYIEYCKARRRGFESLRDDNQPLIEVTVVPQLVNRLNPAANTGPPGRKSNSQFLIPELCAKFSIPSSVYRTCHLLPSIIRRIDDYCLVKEVNAKLFDNWLREDQLLVALSAPSASAEFDYERLELFGDAYLKYLSSIYLFVTYPTQQEGAMHVARQKIISNRVLLQNAREADIPQYIRSKPFTAKNWFPYNFKMARLNIRPPKPNSNEEDIVADESTTQVEVGDVGDMEIDETNPNVAKVVEDQEGQDVAVLDEENEPQGEKESFDSKPERSVEKISTRPKPARKRWDDFRVQWLGDKCVADVAEAIIGAACITGGIESALKIAKDIGCYLPRVDRWSDFGRKALAPPPEYTAELSQESLEAVSEIVGYKIKRKHILAQALTHTSIQGNELPCYERLEFLGDAVLDYLVIGHIFDLYGQLSPGALTLLKGAMVTNTALAAICILSGLDKHIIMDSTALKDTIETYRQELYKARDTEYSLAEKEGRMPGQFWVDIEPPKTLSDVVESVLGAILVTDNFEAGGTQCMYDTLLKPFYDKHIALRTLSHHPTKVLFELFQSRGCQKFEIIREDGVENDEGIENAVRCDVICHDIVLASAIDTTSQLASRRCSFLALDALEGDTEFLVRTCDCRATSSSKSSKRKNNRSEQDAGTEGDKTLRSSSIAEEDDGELDEGEGDELAIEVSLYEDDDDGYDETFELDESFVDGVQPATAISE